MAMKINDFLNIYHDEIPNFMEIYANAPELIRLKDVDMQCGMKYTSFPYYKSCDFYSRYEHSFATGLITWHFTHDKIQTLSSLFHDIATPVFSHTIDFANGDYLKQEYTEIDTYKIISNSSYLKELLEKDNINIQDISNYHIYSLCDNDSPKLCIDRLEYLFSGSLIYGFSNLNELKNIYNDIIVDKNEYDEEELIFKSKEYAIELANIGLKCGKVYVANENRYSMEKLARLINKTLKDKIINYDDLYTNETSVINKIINSKYHDEWQCFTKCNKVIISEIKNDNAYCINAKKRYINPYIKDIGRVYDIDRNFKGELDEFIKLDLSKIYLIGIED